MKQTKCKICRTLYTKRSIMHKTCSMDCALELVKRDKEKRASKALKAAKVEARPRRVWMKLAQDAFNAFIRARDANEPCIDCGGYPKTTGKYGGDWDAGHFLSVGGHPEKRFLEDNCHKQLKSCNAGSGKYTRKGKTVSQAYRERLIIKIGLERVELIESDNEPRKYTIEQLQAVQQEYKMKLKALKEGI